MGARGEACARALQKPFVRGGHAGGEEGEAVSTVLARGR